MIRIFMKKSSTLRRLANGLAQCRLYQLGTSIGSICVHGDSPCAVGMARRLRARLEAAVCRSRPLRPPVQQANAGSHDSSGMAKTGRQR
jgi:hypothetical protein